MKRFKSVWTWFVISLFVMLAIPVVAQDYTKSNETTFVAKQKLPKSSPTKTEYTWVDSDGKSYPIYLSTKSCFIIRTSKKSGKEYRKYLPKEVYQEITNGSKKTLGSKRS